MQRTEFKVTATDSATDIALYSERSSSETSTAHEVFDNVGVNC